MKFSIERKDLLPYIQHLINIVPGKNTMPILTNFLIEADEIENHLIITATDLEITVITTVKANVINGGKIAISARRLMEILIRLPEKMIDFIKKEDDIQINCNSIDYNLLCAETSQFPLVPDVDMSEAAQINAGLFRKMIENTSFAVSTEINRPIFTGINWTLDPEFQMMAATDGKKIAEFKHNKPTHVEERIEKIIPTKGLNFLDKIINESISEVAVLIEDNRVVFQYGSYILMTHVVEGRYPDYNKAIPKNNTNILVIDKGILKEAVNRVSLLAIEDTFKIRLIVKQELIMIDCINRDEGEAHDQIRDFEYEGDDLEIAFNYKFLVAILNVIETDKVEIRFGKNNEGAMLYNHGEEKDYTTRFLLMPLRFL
jgi:DNA polymerase III subunit beta